MLYKRLTLSSILTGLKATIAEIAYRSVPAQQTLLTYVWVRLSRTARRFERLFAHWQAGTVPPIRVYAPRKPRAPRPAPEIPVWPVAVPLPRRRFWLLDILKTHHAAIRAGQLEHLLTFPEIQQFRAEVPRADRLLRPLCHMLGVILPPAPAVPQIAPKTAPQTKPQSPSTPKPPGDSRRVDNTLSQGAFSPPPWPS